MGLVGIPGSILTAVRSSAVDAVRLLMEKSTTQAPTLSFIVIEPADHMSHERLQQLVGSSLPQLTALCPKRANTFFWPAKCKCPLLWYSSIKWI